MKAYTCHDLLNMTMTGEEQFYLASEVNPRIAELEKTLRTVSIIDLGHGAPAWFCAGCAKYGHGADSIAHKNDCLVAKTLSL